MSFVYLQCNRQGSKLRVNITTPGYNNQANCQFPRAIRVEGRRYRVPSSSIKVASGRAGKFFYRISKNSIEILDNTDIETRDEIKPQIPDRIFKSDECLICMDSECEVIFADCGHMCVCEGCSVKLSGNKCIMCRNTIISRIHKKDFQ